MIAQTGTVVVEDTSPPVSWRAILAGATASVALTLMLLAFGVGIGLSVISPWGDSSVSATTFTIAAGFYLIVVAMLASTVGGYLAGRLRTQWSTVHEHERFFRDTAHGFLVWALATAVSAAVLGGAATHIIAGFSAGAAPAGAVASQQQGSPVSGYVDTMLRTDPAAPAAQSGNQGTPGAAANASDGNRGVNRGEIVRILTPVTTKGGKVSDADRAYLVKVVSARTGLPQPEAEQRVNDAITQAKAAADAARKATAKFSLFLVASMLAGALSACFAAVEGGNLRNREWWLTER